MKDRLLSTKRQRTNSPFLITIECQGITGRVFHLQMGKRQRPPVFNGESRAGDIPGKFALPIVDLDLLPLADPAAPFETNPRSVTPIDVTAEPARALPDRAP